MLRLGVQIYARCLNSGTKNLATNHKKINEVLFQPTQIIRNTSFFNKLSAEELWKGVVSVSNAGKKRGRGRGADKKGKKNLNLGQRVGVGKANVLWPGLTTPIIQANTLVNIQQLPKSDESSVTPETKKSSRFTKLHPLERGWSGRSLQGRSIGPPDPDGDVSYNDFDSIVIENKIVATMTAILGRKRRFSATVITGNGKGLIGYGRGLALEGKASVTQAKNKAIKRLVTFNFIEKGTVNHDFFCQYGRSKIFVFKKPEGYGLKCHRAIAACCKLIGIKDIAVKVEGAVNVKNIVKGFIIGLMNQKSFQQIADENNLHLVEYKSDRLNFPNVVASPKTCLTPEEAKIAGKYFDQYIWNDRIVYKRPKPIPFYQKLPSWEKYLRGSAYLRNQKKVKHDLIAEHGDLKSFLSDRYPECQKFKFQPKAEPEKS